MAGRELAGVHGCSRELAAVQRVRASGARSPGTAAAEGWSNEEGQNSREIFRLSQQVVRELHRFALARKRRNKRLFGGGKQEDREEHRNDEKHENQENQENPKSQKNQENHEKDNKNQTLSDKTNLAQNEALWSVETEDECKIKDTASKEDRVDKSFVEDKTIDVPDETDEALVGLAESAESCLEEPTSEKAAVEESAFEDISAVDREAVTRTGAELTEVEDAKVEETNQEGSVELAVEEEDVKENGNENGVVKASGDKEDTVDEEESSEVSHTEVEVNNVVEGVTADNKETAEETEITHILVDEPTVVEDTSEKELVVEKLVTEGCVEEEVGEVETVEEAIKEDCVEQAVESESTAVATEALPCNTIFRSVLTNQITESNTAVKKEVKEWSEWRSDQETEGLEAEEEKKEDKKKTTAEEEDETKVEEEEGIEDAASLKPFLEASEAGETVANEANHQKKETNVEADDQEEDAVVPVNIKFETTTEEELAKDVSKEAVEHIKTSEERDGTECIPIVGLEDVMIEQLVEELHEDGSPETAEEVKEVGEMEVVEESVELDGHLNKEDTEEVGDSAKVKSQTEAPADEKDISEKENTEKEAYPIEEAATQNCDTNSVGDAVEKILPLEVSEEELKEVNTVDDTTQEGCSQAVEAGQSSVEETTAENISVREKVEEPIVEESVSNDAPGVKTLYKEEEATENVVGDEEGTVKNLSQEEEAIEKKAVEEEALTEATVIEMSDVNVSTLDEEKATKIAAVNDTTAQLPELEKVGTMAAKFCEEATEKEPRERVGDKEIPAKEADADSSEMSGKLSTDEAHANAADKNETENISLEVKVEEPLVEELVSALNKKEEATENVLGDGEAPVKNISQEKENVEEEAFKEAATIEMGDTNVAAVDEEKASKIAALNNTIAELPELEKVVNMDANVGEEPAEKEPREKIGDMEIPAQEADTDVLETDEKLSTNETHVKAAEKTGKETAQQECTQAAGAGQSLVKETAVDNISVEENVEVTTAEGPVSNEAPDMKAVNKEKEEIENMIFKEQDTFKNIPQIEEGMEKKAMENEALKEETTIEISDTTSTAVDLEKASKFAAVNDTTEQSPELEGIGAIKNVTSAEAAEKESGEQVCEAEVEVELTKGAVVKEKICVVLAEELAKEIVADNKVAKVEEVAVKEVEADIVTVKGVESNKTNPAVGETEESEALSETVSTVLTSSQSKGRREDKTAPRARRGKMPGSARPIRSLTATMIVEPQPISKLIEFKHLDKKVKKAIEEANSEGEVDSGNDAGSNSSEDENKVRDDSFASGDYLEDDLAKVHTQNMKAKTKETESEGICVIS